MLWKVFNNKKLPQLLKKIPQVINNFLDHHSIQTRNITLYYHDVKQKLFHYDCKELTQIIIKVPFVVIIPVQEYLWQLMNLEACGKVATARQI